jgi:hypothetical protein
MWAGWINCVGVQMGGCEQQEGAWKRGCGQDSKEAQKASQDSLRPKGRGERAGGVHCPWGGADERVRGAGARVEARVRAGNQKTRSGRVWTA